jgi:hypothetical protein
MFRNALQHLHKPLQGSVWTVLAVLSFAGLIIGLDNTVMNDALLSLPGQLSAGDSTLQWIDRAKGIAVWTGAASEAIGPLAGGLLFVASIGRWSF